MLVDKACVIAWLKAAPACVILAVSEPPFKAAPSSALILNPALFAMPLGMPLAPEDGRLFAPGVLAWEAGPIKF